MGSVQITDHKVTEEMDEDYSLEKVPRSQRNMGWLSITNITFGIATAIFYFQMGSVMALQFGAHKCYYLLDLRNNSCRYTRNLHCLLIREIWYECQFII